MSDNSAFYYIDGDPLNGDWVDLEEIDSTEDVLEFLADREIIERDNEGNPEYGGDLLVADIEGDLAHHFYQGYGIFDLTSFIEVRDSDVDEEVACAYISLFSDWDEDRCNENYLGHYDSQEDYARDYVDQCGFLSELPENLRYYFDYDRFGNDLMISDICEDNGHYFNNW